MEHANRGDDFIVGSAGLPVAASLEAAGGAVRGRNPGLGGLEGVASLSGALLLGSPLALAADGERGVEADRMHPASTGTGERVSCRTCAGRSRAARAASGPRRGLPHA